MVALKSLSDNANISVISIFYWLSIFILFAILLVPGKTSYSLLKLSHFVYYIMRLWILLKLSFLAVFLWYCPSSRRWWWWYLINIRWEWNFKFPTQPPLIHKEGGFLLQLGGGGVLTLHEVSNDTSLNGKGRNASLLLPLWSPLIPRKGGWPCYYWAGAQGLPLH